MKKQINQIRAGVLLSYVNLALSSLIPMFYTPVMLRILGQAEHGLYSLAHSTVGYLTLLSFGFGSTIIRYLAKYRAQNDREGVRRIFGFFLLLYSGLAVLVMAGGILLTQLAPSIFDSSLSAAELDTVKKLIPLMAVQTALNFPFSVYTSVLLAHERYLYRRIMDILATLITPLFNLVMLYLGYASVGLVFSSLIVQFILFLPNVVYCTRVLGLTPSFHRMPGGVVREMVGFSAFVFLDSIVDMLFGATDKVLLGMLVGSAAVSIYQIGGTFNSMVMQFSASFSGVLVPKITGMIVRDAAPSQLTELFTRIGRLQFLVVALAVTGFASFGQAFIALWAGPEYRDAYWVTVLTMFPLCVPLIQNTGYQILMATNRHRFRAVVYLIVAIANVATTWFAIPYMGIVGAALCSCVTYLCGHGLAINLYYYKVVHLDIPAFWKQIGRMSLIPGCMMFVTIMLQRFVSIDSWLTFFPGVIVYAGAYCLLMYRFCMNDYERSIIHAPLNKIRTLLRR